MSGARPVHQGLDNMQIHPGSHTAWIPLTLTKGYRRASYFISQAQEIGKKKTGRRKRF